jgi:exosortase
VTDSTAVSRARALQLSFGGGWPLALAFLVLAGPSMWTLAQEAWATDQGAHGPIVLLTGGWLLWRLWPTFKAEGRPGDWRLTALALLVSLPIYVFGRAYDYLLLEAAGLYGAGVAILQSRFGIDVLRRNWFPFFYLAFAIPLPGWLLDQVTSPLKEMISVVVTNVLHAAGVPIAREGVTIFVAQYQLLVEDACSGLNSLIGLSAVSLFYIHLMHRASWRYSLLLAAFVIPIAVIANMIRVATLVMLTYWFGDEVGQGFMHEGTGVFLFATSLLLIFALDNLLRSSVLRRRRTA